MWLWIRVGQIRILHKIWKQKWSRSHYFLKVIRSGSYKCLTPSIPSPAPNYLIMVVLQVGEQFGRVDAATEWVFSDPLTDLSGLLFLQCPTVMLGSKSLIVQYSYSILFCAWIFTNTEERHKLEISGMNKGISLQNIKRIIKK